MRDTPNPTGTLNDWAKLVHQTSREKGWYEPESKRTLGDVIALMHSELSEALEEYRNGNPVSLVYFVTDRDGNKKPEGVSVELIDCIIRIMDTLVYYGVDMEYVMSLKAEYNKLRPYKHGGKLL